MSRTVYEELTVRINPLADQIRVEMQKKGVISVKNISLDDLLNSISDSKVESKVITSGFLPENCLSVTIKNKLKSVVLWLPAGRCDYTYFKTTYENFPMPNMVFGFDVNPDGKVQGYRMAVVDKGTPKPDTVLYEYPFSNVYSNTYICIGGANSLPLYKKLHTLASLPHHILTFPNNDHEFYRTHNKLHLGYRELLDHLSDKDSSYYYDSVLVPRKDKKTVQDFIDRTVYGNSGGPF